MNFNEAEARFQWIESQRAAGRMNEQAYRDELNQLRVVDVGGRTWMMQERTGQWHVYDGRQWVPASPPVQPAYPSPSPVPPGQAYPPARQAGPAQAGQGGCAKILVYLAIWFVIWVIIAVAVYIFVGQKEPMVLFGVGAAALLSLVLMVFSLASQWQGQIMEIKTERVRVRRGQDHWGWENQTLAIIRQPNGRTRKMRAMPDWRVGDQLEKRRGESHIRKL